MVVRRDKPKVLPKFFVRDVPAMFVGMATKPFVHHLRHFMSAAHQEEIPGKCGSTVPVDVGEEAPSIINLEIDTDASIAP